MDQRQACSIPELSPDGGILEDIGERLPFEEPFWSGHHPATVEAEDALAITEQVFRFWKQNKELAVEYDRRSSSGYPDHPIVTSESLPSSAGSSIGAK